MKRLARTTIYGSIAAAALCLASGLAIAADMTLPTKAPPPPPAPPPSNWSAFLVVGYNFGQMNPQGQAVYKLGDYNLVGGANLSLYKSKDGFINSWSVGGLGIIDWTSGAPGPSDAVWAGLNPTENGSALYYILQANTSVTFAQYWTLTEEFFHLGGANANGGVLNPNNTLPLAPPPPFTTGSQCANPFGTGAGLPPLALGCLSLPGWNWNNLRLSFSDGLITHWPISFNPYVTWWYNFFPSGFAGINGTTTEAACFSCNSEHTDFLIGMEPKMNMQPYWGVPLTLTAPTWFTVGSKSFWAGTNPSGIAGSACVLIGAQPATIAAGTNCSTSNIGIFTTGLTGVWGLTSIPAQWGHWFVKGGFQWFDIVNKALQADNAVTWGLTSFGLQQNIVVGFVGLGVGF